MTRKIFSLLALITLAAAVSLNAEPRSRARHVSRKGAPTITPATPLAEGWSYVNGEWVHSDGYKYLNGQVVRTGVQTHKLPPRPPTEALLRSVKGKPTPMPDLNSAAAKAAEKERNLRARPAPQTGSHL